MAAPKPNLSSSIWLIVAGLVVISALGLFGGGGGGGGSDAIPYSQFQQYLDANKVKQVTVSGNVIRGTLTEPMPDGRSNFTTVQVPPDLAGQLAKHNVEFTGGAADGGAVGTLLSWVLPPLLFVGIWMFASRMMMGGARRRVRRRAAVGRSVEGQAGGGDRREGQRSPTWPGWTRRRTNCTRSSIS